MKISTFFSAILISLFSFQAFSQIEFAEDKVKFKFSIKQETNCEATVIAEVNIVPNWHIYSVVLPKGSFGIATTFKLNPSKDYQLIGGVVEPKPIQKYDELADEHLSFHAGKVILKQRIKILIPEKFTLSGTYGFQTCDENHCLPPYEGTYKLSVLGCENTTAQQTTTSTPEATTNTDTSSQETTTTQPEEKLEIKATATEKVQDETDVTKMSVFMIFILSFGSGFLALLTPCVFPMIPMTVSFFTKRSSTRAKGIKNALIYGISIIVIYIILGVAVTAIFGADSLNNMSTNPTFNLIFFGILVVFAVSFMGAFEIRMPNKWVNSADNKADKGGMIGIFFMALALALVSFSCTGPIVGFLLVQSATVGGMAPVIGMFGFSLALALPFALFAMIPGWMNSLPKSGGWLNTVKVVLGLLELAFAFKFLSNADLALQLHYLEREVFLAIWIAIFGFLTAYLMGWIQLPHDSKVEKISVGRASMAMFSFMFVIYMIPGMWGAPLKLISAFPPPLNYSESPFGVGYSQPNASTNNDVEIDKDMHLGPQNIYLFHDYDKALAYAKKVNKPLFVDFTGHNCVNCRKMEQSVWGETGIIEKLRNDVVIASLHVDERIELPTEQQVKVELTPGKFKTLQTTGDKWMYKQIKEYQVTAQPYYIMLDANEKVLKNGPANYQNHSSPAVFKEWLDEGLEDFESKK